MFTNANMLLQTKYTTVNTICQRKYFERGYNMLTYTKLWLLLSEKGMKKTDLREVLSSATLAKLGKNEPVSSTIIERICDYLNCQPGDIMENVRKEDLEQAGEIANKKIAETIDLLSNTTGMSKEAILDEFMKEVPKYIDRIKNGEEDILGINSPKESK